MVAEINYTLLVVASGTAFLGINSGVIGSYAVLRGQSLLGDAISHAALPGICLAFLLTGSSEASVLLIGAFLAGGLGTAFISIVTETTRVKYDSALGLVLSVFFGWGLVLLTLIQKRPNADQAGLDNFLFGQASTLLRSDVLVISAISIISLSVVVVFWKEFKLFCFDSKFAAIQGFSVEFLDLLLTILLVVAIVIGLQAVGVILMSSLLIAPGAAARQWTNKLSVMFILSGFIGSFAGVGGTLISASVEKLPTGPVIVILLSVIVVSSFIFAPDRGLLSRCKSRKEVGGD